MKGGVEPLIAWRFLLKGTEKGRFSPMTLFAWIAIAVGVSAMASFLAIMYGFESNLKDRVLKAYPHVMVKPRQGNVVIRNYKSWSDRFNGLPEVKRSVAFLEREMIVQSTQRTLGAVVWGMSEKDLNSLKPEVSDGVLPDPKAKIPQMLVGRELAHRMALSVGQQVRLVSPIKRSGALGLVPRSQVFEVSGYYASGHYEFDQQYLFLVLEDFQDLLKVGDAISGWHLWGSDVEQADAIEARITPILPDVWQAQSWSVFNSALFASLKLEQYSMFIILTFAVLIAVMNIVITLTMHVTQKQRNIGVLRALGASKKQIQRIFLWQGVLLGVVGLALGALMTVAFLTYVRTSNYLLPEIYYDRSVPIEVRPWSLVIIYSVAIAMIYIATLIPSRKAATVHPVESIRGG